MEKTEKLRRWRNLILAGAAAAAVIALLCVLVYRGAGIQCLIYEHTGWLCPGCGNTRAVKALLRLNIVAALRYNMLFPLEIFYLGWVALRCCRAYLKGKAFSYHSPCKWLDISVLIALLLWGVLRNIL